MTRTAHEENASRSGAQIGDKILVLHRLPRSSFKLTCTDIEADRKGGRACALGLLIRTALVGRLRQGGFAHAHLATSSKPLDRVLNRWGGVWEAGRVQQSTVARIVVPQCHAGHVALSDS